MHKKDARTRSERSVIEGVTLLEIMLVLAIVAMIIVMSVRYYQSTTAIAEANACLNQLQAFVATADSLSEATSSYSGITLSTLKQITLMNNASCVKNMRVAGRVLAFDIRYSSKQVCYLVLSELAKHEYNYWSSNTVCSGDKNKLCQSDQIKICYYSALH